MEIGNKMTNFQRILNIERTGETVIKISVKIKAIVMDGTTIFLLSK
ncbi:MAG: hypothetical protein GYA51_00080 [Candidatus Methanofastidiosa archaeon]|nr:hypothetical protein [Candidatus Methanofastidiosa archaeon]